MLKKTATTKKTPQCNHQHCLRRVKEIISGAFESSALVLMHQTRLGYHSKSCTIHGAPTVPAQRRSRALSNFPYLQIAEPRLVAVRRVQNILHAKLHTSHESYLLSTLIMYRLAYQPEMAVDRRTAQQTFQNSIHNQSAVIDSSNRDEGRYVCN